MQVTRELYRGQTKDWKLDPEGDGEYGRILSKGVTWLDLHFRRLLLGTRYSAKLSTMY